MELKEGIKQINQSVTQSSASDATLEGYMLELKDANGNLVDKQPVNKLENLMYNYLATKRQNELAKVMSTQSSLAGANSNVMILYHRKSDNVQLMTELGKWSSLQASGEIATGVVVVDGERTLIVAPTEASPLYWSSADVSAGGKATTDKTIALGNFDGKASTAAQITHTECQGASYAAGYCNQYSRTNANSKGLTAGSWWLPSMGELMIIYANMRRINYALSLITGATQLAETWYWSSTEVSAVHAWGFPLSNGHVGYDSKATNQGRVRPVSSISLNLPSFYKDYNNVGELATAVGGNQNGDADGFVKFINTFIDNTIDEHRPNGIFPLLGESSSNRGFVFRFFSNKHSRAIEILFVENQLPSFRINASGQWGEWIQTPSYLKDYPNIASLSKGVGGLVNPDVAVKIDFDKMLTGGVYCFNTADNSPFSDTNGGYGMLIVIQGVSDSLLRKRLVQIAISLSGETKLRTYSESGGFKEWKTISIS